MAKHNYINLLTTYFQKGRAELFDKLIANYVYQQGLNDNNGYRDITIDGKKYSTVYGEIFTQDINGMNSLKLFINIAKHYGVDFFGDIGSGRGMLPVALNDVVKKSFGVELLSARHNEAVKFMNNVLNTDNSWNGMTTRLSEALGHAVKPENVDSETYENRVTFTHNTTGKVLEYLNGDMLYVNWADLLRGYKRGMFWISNLCFNELTEDLFAIFKDKLPIGTIIILSRLPKHDDKNVEKYNFKKLHNPELGIINGKLSVPQTWNHNDYVMCLEFVGASS